MTGMGFTSANRAWHSGSAFSCSSRLFAVSPENHAAQISCACCNIGKHADDALTAQGQDRHNLVIVARINVQFLATQGCNIRNLGDIAAGFLYSVYIGQLGKLRQCGGLQIHTGTGRNIVNDAGQGNGICNGRIVGNQARLAGSVFDAESGEPVAIKTATINGQSGKDFKMEVLLYPHHHMDIKRIKTEILLS